MAAAPAQEEDRLIGWLRTRVESSVSPAECIDQLLVDITSTGMDFFGVRHNSTLPTTDSPFNCSCGSILYKPTTRKDGISQCSSCVEEQGMKTKSIAEDTRGNIERPAVNVLLARLVNKCCGDLVHSVGIGKRGSDAGLVRDSVKTVNTESLVPDDPITQARREDALDLKGLYASALEDTNTALALSPRHCKIHYHKAQILDVLGRTEESLASLMACLVLEEDVMLRQHTAKMLDQYLSTQAGKCGSDMWIQKLCKLLCLCSQELSAKPVLHATHGLQGRLALEDFDCVLCHRLLHKPVSTPCGHVFCRSCLNRSLDHRPSCPACRGSLEKYLTSILGRSQPVTMELERMIQLFFPDEYRTRDQLYAQELRQLAGPRLGCLPPEADIPVLVCGPAFPSVYTRLHIFEPRYRLMLRRCLESEAYQFGMCQQSDQSQMGPIGTMLTVQGVQFLADGRLMVDTVGGKRFKVLKYGMLDGYGRAVVKYFSDDKVQSGQDLTVLRALSMQVHEATENWFASLSTVIKDRIISSCGKLPPYDPLSDPQAKGDGPDWVWWACAVLQGQLQAADVLASTSLRDRLQMLQRVLDEQASIVRVCRTQ